MDLQLLARKVAPVRPVHLWITSKPGQNIRESYLKALERNQMQTNTAQLPAFGKRDYDRINISVFNGFLPMGRPQSIPTEWLKL